MSNLIASAVETLTKVTVNQLAEILKGITKSTVCNVIYTVDDSRSRTIAGKKQVQKQVQIKHVFLNHDYQNKVRNLTGVTDFVAMELKGKSRVCSTLVASDKTRELMLDGKVLSSGKPEILGFYHNGNEVTEMEAIALELWAPAYYNPSDKETAGRGLVMEEDNFNIINPYLSRINRIKLEGTWYLVTKG